MTTGHIGRARAAARLGLRIILGTSAFAAVLLGGMSGTEDANANGDTRTITIQNERTQESATITFRRNGAYDQAALKQLDWMLRDWRTDEAIRMEPRLFDILWQVYREVGASEPIQVLSAYRSPGTNAMLRRRSRAVSEHSQHMHGKALDFRIGGVSMSQVREIGMRLQQGGVGFYPGASFVHLDAGSVRSWPRMPNHELARLFPDGRTVHIPRDGKPMPGYEEAKAIILARGGSVAGYATYAEGEEAGPRKSLWATLFGGGDDEDSDFYRSTAARTRASPRSQQVAAYAPTTPGDDAGIREVFRGAVPAGQGLPAERRRPAVQVAAATPSGPPQGFEPEPAALLAPPPSLPARGPNPAAIQVLETAPVPPRRPDEMATLVAAAPLPPLRPSGLSPVGGSAPVLATQLRGQMGSAPRLAAAGDDERAALRALFDTVATGGLPARRAEVPTSRTRVQPIALAAILDEPGTRVRMSFSSGTPDEPSAGAFAGPAVAPLPILR